jgi:hypothetical protein
MFAHSTATRFGLGSILVALSIALGGCAESVASGPVNPSAPFGDRNAVTLQRFVPPRTHADAAVPEVKTAALVTHGVAKRATLVTGMAH